MTTEKYNYQHDRATFEQTPSPQAAAHMLASAMYASGQHEIDDSELIEAVLAIRDYLYRSALS